MTEHKEFNEHAQKALPE